MPPKKKPTAKTISKEDLLYQPLTLAVNGYGATAFQQNTVIAILRKLKGAIKEMRDNQFSPQQRQLTLFDTMDVQRNNYLKKGDIVFDLHMRELGISPKHYQEAFNTVCKTGSIMVWVPMKMDGRDVMMLDNLFNVVSENVREVRDPHTHAVIRYEYVNRSPQCTIVIPHAVAAYLFPPESRIYDFLEPTAMLMADKSPKRLYMYLSNFKNMKDGYTVDYRRFRHDIGMNDEEAPIDPETKERKIMYPYYSYFEKGVIRPAYEQMKKLCEEGLCDFWFEVETIYDRPGRQKNPDKLHFTFHFSEMGQALRQGKIGVKEAMEIEMQLLNDLAQTRSQVKELMSKVNDTNRNRFLQKVKQLVSDSRKPREVPIANLKAWANRSLTAYLEELEDLPQEMMVQEEAAAPMTKPQNEVICEEPVPLNPAKPIYSERELNMWSEFLNTLKDMLDIEDPKEFHTYWTCNKYGGIHDGCLCILVPTTFVYQQVSANDTEYVKTALQKVYKTTISSFKWGLDPDYRP